MCGIIGSKNFDFNESFVASSLNAITHRGPDSNGIYVTDNKKFAVGHTRLSILDMSSSANQPFHSKNGRYVLVYNGEIYNYKELANKHALALNTSCDTEVVLKLYEAIGNDFVSELNGMFAGAILDRQEQSIFLFRDRLGIKPLYYYKFEDRFAFCSELPALLSIVGKQDIEKNALGHFLHRGYIPEPLTFYQNIYKFSSGSIATFKNSELSINHYWRAEDQILSNIQSSEKKCIAELEESLRESVKMRLMADVPFGTFLSGGADSGLISAIAADLTKKPISTFNVSFEDAVFDETPFARRMSEIIGSKHHNIVVRKDDVMESLKAGMALVGEPFADSSTYPTMAVSKFASKYIKMALSGDGGDELFMGYGAYHWAKRFENPMIMKHRRLIASMLRMTGNSRRRRAANVFDFGKDDNMLSHIFSQEQNLFTASEIKELTDLPFNDPFNSTVFDQMPRKINNAEKQAFFDLTNYLKDDLLVKVDRASMRYGLEVRVPFLDHRLVEYSLNIDPRLKTKNGESKYLVKKMMQRYFPDDLIYRKKWGFSIPLERWMKENQQYKWSAPDNPKYASVYRKLAQKYSSNLDFSYLFNRLYVLQCLSQFS